MKNPSKVLLATAALITIHSTPGLSEPILQATQSGTQGEISRLEKNIKKNYRDIKSINDLGVVQLKLGHYDEAITQFKKAQKFNPDDKCSNMYVERCELLKKRDPKDWDGVWVATSK